MLTEQEQRDYRGIVLLLSLVYMMRWYQEFKEQFKI